VRRHRELGSGGNGGSAAGSGSSGAAAGGRYKNGGWSDIPMERIGEYKNPAYAPSNSLSVRRKESLEHLDTCT